MPMATGILMTVHLTIFMLQWFLTYVNIVSKIFKYLSQVGVILQYFAENCMKMKEFGPPGRGRVAGAPSDPPMPMHNSLN